MQNIRRKLDHLKGLKNVCQVVYTYSSLLPCVSHVFKFFMWLAAMLIITSIEHSYKVQVKGNMHIFFFLQRLRSTDLL